WVGDIDVLIKRPLCERYWEFLEVLGLHEVASVFDVLDRPEFPWKPCRQQIAHAKALTVDCCANLLMPYGMKHVNLDICFKASDLDAIPRSSRWVHLLEPKDLDGLDDAAMKVKISEGHQDLINDLKQSEKDLPNRSFQADLKLWFGW